MNTGLLSIALGSSDAGAPLEARRRRTRVKAAACTLDGGGVGPGSGPVAAVEDSVAEERRLEGECK